MSKYSGKCDFCDVVGIWGPEVVLNCDIKIGKHKTLIVNKIDDLKPYYNHLISMMSISRKKNPDTGKQGIVFICEKSYWEQRKDEIREIYINNPKKMQERIAQIDEFYSKYSNIDELKVPRYEVHYGNYDEPEEEYIKCFETKVAAEEYINQLDQVKNVYMEAKDVDFEE